jgi:MraZ protein
MEVEIDGQGRINLNGNLKKHAQIDKEIVFVGMNNFIEIWSKKLWEPYKEKASEIYEEVAENLADLGI